MTHYHSSSCHEVVSVKCGYIEHEHDKLCKETGCFQTEHKHTDSCREVRMSCGH